MATQFQQLTNRILSAEIWVAVIIVGASIIMPRLLPGALLMMSMFWILRKAVCGQFTKRTSVDWGIWGITIVYYLILRKGDKAIQET